MKFARDLLETSLMGLGFAWILHSHGQLVLQEYPTIFALVKRKLFNQVSGRRNHGSSRLGIICITGLQSLISSTLIVAHYGRDFNTNLILSGKTR